MEEHLAVGKGIANTNAVEKARGSALFVADIKLNGMLTGEILRSPLPHGRVLSVDISRAERLPGVKAVIVATDAPNRKFSVSPTWADKAVLAEEKVRYIGDEIAAVAAVDRETAEEAIDLIRVEYEELPAVYDPVEAMRPGAPILHDSAGNNVAKHFVMECGDVEAGFAQADLIVEDVFRTHAQSHCSLESHGCVAVWDLSDRITLWVSAQAPHVLRVRLAQVLDMDPSRIHVVTPYVGGGFGSKIDLEPLHVICALLAKKSGRPVQIVNSRSDQFTTTRVRHPTISELKFGVKNDGTFLAKQARVIMDNGAYNSHGPTVLAYNNVMFSTLYRVENIRYEGYLVYTNKNWGGACRGYGDPQATFGQEVMIDMIARELGMDPVELRLRNANRPYETTANGVRITSCGLEECLLEAQKAAGWLKKTCRKSAYGGIGVAAMTYTGGGSIGSGYNFSGASMQMNADGSLHLLVGAVDIGQGSNTILTQMAAEIMGVEPDRIRLQAADTDTTFPCMGTFGSRVTFCAGNAVTQAARSLRLQVLEEAADLLEAKVEDLEFRDKNVFVKGSPGRAVSYSEIGAASFYRKKKPLVGHGYYNGPTVPDDFDPMTYRGYPSPCMVFGVHVAEVEVDPDTGKVDVKRFIAAHDLGKTINPLLAEGQIEGGVVQGIGWALTEDLKFENGKILNCDFHDYKILTIKDIPEIHPIFIETDDPNGPFGAKGIGECAMVPTAPAIVNAIYDAVGVRIKELPASPEKILTGFKRVDR